MSSRIWGVTPYIALEQQELNVSNSHFSEGRFRHDPVADAYHGLGGQVLDTCYVSPS